MGRTKSNCRQKVAFQATGTKVFQPRTSGVVPERWEVTIENGTNGDAVFTLGWKDQGVSTTLENKDSITVATGKSLDVGTFLSSHDELSMQLTAAGANISGSNAVTVRVTCGPREGGVNTGGYAGYARGDSGTTWDAAGFEVLAAVS